MKSPTWIRLALLISLFSFSANCDAADAPAKTKVLVELSSGRTLHAYVDERTDADQLWLRFQTESTVLLRPIDWDSVRSVTHEGREYTSAQFRPMATTLAVSEVSFQEETQDEAAEQPADDPTDRQPMATLAAKALGLAPPIAALHVNAFAANWDADVEVDGVVVQVTAVDQAGFPRAVGGTFEAVLLGSPSYGNSRTRPVGRTRRLGRWVKITSPKHFHHGPAVYRLEFQGVNPEFDLKLAPIGALVCKLSVPGQGTFEATVTDLRVRPYSAFRDGRELRGEPRFDPLERTHR